MWPDHQNLCIPVLSYAFLQPQRFQLHSWQKRCTILKTDLIENLKKNECRCPSIRKLKTRLVQYIASRSDHYTTDKKKPALPNAWGGEGFRGGLAAVETVPASSENRSPIFQVTAQSQYITELTLLSEGIKKQLFWYHLLWSDLGPNYHKNLSSPSEFLEERQTDLQAVHHFHF